MNTIKFSHNWNNKLNNDIFTTIRNHTLEKEKYYRKQIGEIFEVELQEKKTGEARLMKVEVKEYIEIDFNLLMLDTGMTNLRKITKLFLDFGMEDYMSDMLILTFAKP